MQGVTYYLWNGTATGSGVGSADASFVGVFSGSIGALSKNQGSQTISGSQGLGGTSGSVWNINIFPGVTSTVAQGAKSGSICARYNYT